MPIKVDLGNGNKQYFQGVVNRGELVLFVNEVSDGEALAINCPQDGSYGTVHRLAVDGFPPVLVEVLDADIIEPGKPYVHPEEFGYMGAIGRLSLNFINPNLN